MSQYEGIARDVLSALLDKYAVNGIAEIEQVAVLQIDPFRTFGAPAKILKVFGGRQAYLDVIKDLQNEIYVLAA